MVNSIVQRHVCMFFIAIVFADLDVHVLHGQLHCTEACLHVFHRYCVCRFGCPRTPWSIPLYRGMFACFSSLLCLQIWMSTYSVVHSIVQRHVCMFFIAIVFADLDVHVLRGSFHC